MGNNLNCSVDKFLLHTGHSSGSLKQKTFLSQCWKHRIPGSVFIVLTEKNKYKKLKDNN